MKFVSENWCKDEFKDKIKNDTVDSEESVSQNLFQSRLGVQRLSDSVGVEKSWFWFWIYEITK